LLRRIKETRLATATTTKEKNQIAEAFQENVLVGDDESDFEGIPDSWLACRVGAIGAVVNGSTPSRKRAEFWGGEIPWVSSGEVRNTVITATRERITKAGYEGCSVRTLPRGTLTSAKSRNAATSST
jgi:type I restriction enzyme S subunit